MPEDARKRLLDFVSAPFVARKDAADKARAYEYALRAIARILDAETRERVAVALEAEAAAMDAAIDAPHIPTGVQMSLMANPVGLAHVARFFRSSERDT